MLAALLQNNNNARVEERPPTVHVDRGGGGPLWGPRYDIVDIANAVATFPEVAGEDSVVRAIRRTRWIGEALPRIKEVRERQQAVAFLAGVQVADRAAREEFAAAEKLTIEQLVQIIDEIRGTPPFRVSIAARPAMEHARSRGETGGGIGGDVAIAVGLLIGGALIGAVFARRTAH